MPERYLPERYLPERYFCLLYSYASEINAVPVVVTARIIIKNPAIKVKLHGFFSFHFLILSG